MTVSSKQPVPRQRAEMASVDSVFAGELAADAQMNAMRGMTWHRMQEIHAGEHTRTPESAVMLVLVRRGTERALGKQRGQRRDGMGGGQVILVGCA